MGVCSVEKLSREGAAYVCGYVTRKVLQPVSSKRVRPFIRMSNQRGIGYGAVADIASDILRYRLEDKPVPVALRSGHGGLLLGRYLRGKLAEQLGQVVPYVGNSAEVQCVLDYAFSRSVSAREVFRELNEAFASQLSQGEKIHKEI